MAQVKIKPTPLNAFISKILTVSDRADLEEDIDIAEKAIWELKMGFLSAKIADKVSGPFMDLVLLEEKSGALTTENPTQEEFLATLKKELRKIPEIKLTLSFEPSRDFVEKLGDWLFQNLQKHLLLDILVKPEIIGGVLIEYNGKYKDYSMLPAAKKIIAKHLLTFE